MSEVIIPPWIVPEQESHEWIDDGSSIFRAAFAPGLAQRQSYGGLRLKMSRRHTVRGEEKAQLLSALQMTQGGYNVLRTRVHFALRGSFPATELLSIGVFSSGTSGWDAGSQFSITSADRVISARRSSVTASSVIMNPSATVACSQYQMYSARWATIQGRGAFSSGLRVDIGSTASGGEYVGGTAFTTYGLRTEVAVPTSTTLSTRLVDVSASGQLAGDSVGINYVSLARCALADNGGNALLQSDELDTTWTAQFSVIDDQARVAPDGTTTADDIVDTATTQIHGVSQAITVSSATRTYAYSCAIKAGTRTWAFLQIDESTSNHAVRAWVNLSTGALGSVSTTGANWSNARSYVTSLGNGWYRLHLIAAKVSAATTLTAYVCSSTGDGVTSFLGNGSSYITAWRATLTNSEVPTGLRQTTTTSDQGASQTGTSINLKGLPASTDALLLPGDFFEVAGEIKIATSALNSDSAGLGTVHFSPPLVRAAAADEPIHFAAPMGKFLVSNIKIDNDFGTQARVSYDLEHIYE